MLVHLLVLSLFRCINALLVHTSFNPDEYWQSLEVAHRHVFGNGALTWEWMVGLRGYAHVLVFMGPFQLLKALHLDSRAAVLYVPKLLQGLAACWTDITVARLSNKAFGESIARFTVVCQLLSWFNLFCLPRTYSNNLEALLVVHAIHHWPNLLHPAEGRRAASGSRVWCLAAAALCVILRPSSVMFWLVLGARELLVCRDPLRFVLLECVPVAGVSIAASMGLDRVWYGRWLFVPWEFFKFNVLSGGSAQYGSHPWHWNFTQGFPVVLGPLLPLLLHAVLRCPQRQLLWLALLVLLLYSLPAHKEFRFLLPAHLLCMPCCGWSLSRLFAPVAAKEQAPTQEKGASPRRKPQQPGRRWWRAAGGVLLLLNIPLALYVLLVHQRGNIAVMDHIAALSAGQPDLRVLFLMPCHSTPFFSHVHHNISMRFLDCSPPGLEQLVQQANPGTVITSGKADSATSLFMQDPRGFVDEYLPGDAVGTELNYVVTLDELAEPLGGWLQQQRCRLDARFFNAHLSNHHELQRFVEAYRCGPVAVGKPVLGPDHAGMGP